MLFLSQNKKFLKIVQKSTEVLKILFLTPNSWKKWSYTSHIEDNGWIIQQISCESLHQDTMKNFNVDGLFDNNVQEKKGWSPKSERT